MQSSLEFSVIPHFNIDFFVQTKSYQIQRFFHNIAFHTRVSVVRHFLVIRTTPTLLNGQAHFSNWHALTNLPRALCKLQQPSSRSFEMRAKGNVSYANSYPPFCVFWHSCFALVKRIQGSRATGSHWQRGYPWCLPYEHLCFWCCLGEISFLVLHEETQKA